jgi:N-acetylglutamate synthase-like GNAT family acetyltransferase
MSTDVDAGAMTVPSEVGTDGSAVEGERAVLNDGSSVTILSLTVGDEASIVNRFASWFAALTPENLYARSLSLLHYIQPRVDARSSEAKRFQHEAIAAIASDGVVVGIARLLGVEEPGSAEVMVTVADGWQQDGLAGVLLERIAERARSIGIDHLIARCLAIELTLIRLLNRLGPTTVEHSRAGLVDVRIELS